MIYLAYKHLDAAAEGDEFTEYHLQAAIAGCHAAASSYELTDWAEIVRLYDLLVALNPSPVVALNRAVAVAKWKGPEAGIRAIEEIVRHPAMQHYYLLPATLGELWREMGDAKKAADFYRQALNHPARSRSDGFCRNGSKPRAGLESKANYSPDSMANRLQEAYASFRTGARDVLPRPAYRYQRLLGIEPALTGAVPAIHKPKPVVPNLKEADMKKSTWDVSCSAV